GDEVAFGVVVALRHHGAVETEGDAVDGQRGLDLAQDFIAYGLIGGATDQPAGIGPGNGSLDKVEVTRSGASAGVDQGRSGQAWDIAVGSGTGVEALVELVEAEEYR